jgi:hypothetical protein
MQKILVTIEESGALTENNLLATNPLVEFTLGLYDEKDHMIYVNTFKGRLGDVAITSVLQNIIIPKQIANRFGEVKVYLDLVAYNSNRQKIQYAPIVDPTYSELVNTYVKSLYHEYRYRFEVNSEMENIELTLTLIKESDMITFCANGGYSLDGQSFDNIDDYVGKLLQNDAKIVISKLQSDKYKKDSARILKNTLDIKKYEGGELFIQSINSFRDNHLSELADKYNTLLKYSEPTGNDKIKAKLIKTINESLTTYLDILAKENEKR